MVKTLQDLCRDAKDRQNLTIQDLSDMTDISASTISNFFLRVIKGAERVQNGFNLCRAWRFNG